MREELEREGGVRKGGELGKGRELVGGGRKKVGKERGGKWEENEEHEVREEGRVKRISLVHTHTHTPIHTYTHTHPT